MFFENIIEVEAYAGVEHKVDFSTIETAMEEKDYIWKGFIRDMGYIVNNAVEAFEENHKVYKAAIKMDERMRFLLANLPIMLNWFSKIREGIPEKQLIKEEEERELSEKKLKEAQESENKREQEAKDDENEAVKSDIENGDAFDEPVEIDRAPFNDLEAQKVESDDDDIQEVFP